jgi:uncharacterized protein (DUF608 family)
MPRTFNGPYSGDHLTHIGFPLGGLGAGMLCLEGTGAFNHVSLRHKPELYREPLLFAALQVAGETPVARVLQGPVHPWKIFGPSPGQGFAGTGNGSSGKIHGLPHCTEATFAARFPFGMVSLEDAALPVEIEITGWSPFTPGDADSSSLPVAMVEYALTNPTEEPLDVVFSFHAENLLRKGDGAHGVRSAPGGFLLWQEGTPTAPWDAGACLIAVDASEAVVNHRWFRGQWFDSLTMLWGDIANGRRPAHPPVEEGTPSPGGSLYVPCTLAPGETRLIAVRLSWYVPRSELRQGPEAACQGGCDCATAPTADQPTYQPWYAGRFADIEAVGAFWAAEAAGLRARSAMFRDCFYRTVLPEEVVEAVAANLTILKSPTLLRQTDGRLWCWEGCCDAAGCCHGSCTHVWNYAQALPHLFPELERTLRTTEFHDSQDARGHQNFRASLPIRPTDHTFHAAADGQLGGVMKVYRDWRIGGDTAWLRDLWPQVRQSLDYCIATWDPERTGLLVEPHHNTYDIEFWGPDGMCSSFYLGALRAAAAMADAVGEPAADYRTLADCCQARLEDELYSGEYFIQQIRWEGMRAPNPQLAAQASMATNYSPEALDLLQEEGPKYQYGTGCLSDGVLGAWMADVCGLGPILDPAKVTSHLQAVHRYNLHLDLSTHANPQRPGYALGAEGGLLLCSWPHGGAPSLPFVYSNEVWTGIEYQVASHLIRVGEVDAGLEIVRIARARYDGRLRNPFDEYECGHWYARALSSYALLFALTGARYDAVTHSLHLAPRVDGDFAVFLATATGYGRVGLQAGMPFIEVWSGEIVVERVFVER